MRNLLLVSSILLVSTIILNSCKVDADVPVVETLPIDSCSYDMLITGGNVINDGGDNVTSRGVCISIDSDIMPSVTSTMGDVYWTYDGGGLGKYTSTVITKWTGTNGSIRHRHYIRAYATNGAGTGYGEIIEYNPGPKPLTADIVTLHEPEVDSTIITITYNLKPNGCDIVEFALCYDTITAPTIDKWRVDIANPLEENPIILRDLELDQSYFFRIYMKNVLDSVVYSNQTSCTTN